MAEIRLVDGDPAGAELSLAALSEPGTDACLVKPNRILDLIGRLRGLSLLLPPPAPAAAPN